MQADWRSGQHLEWVHFRWKINQKKIKKSLDKCVTMWYNTQALERVHESEKRSRVIEPWKLNNDEIKKGTLKLFCKFRKTCDSKFWYNRLQKVSKWRKSELDCSKNDLNS